MARASTSFSCTSCGQASLRWMGRCPGCGEWNTLVEQAGDPQADRRVSLGDGRVCRTLVTRRRPGGASQAGRARSGRARRDRAPADRQRGVRSRAGRGPRAGFGGAARRLSRDRQEHPDERCVGAHPGSGPLHALRQRRGVGGAGEAAGGAPGRPRARGPRAGGDVARGGARLPGAGAPAGMCGRLGTDPLVVRPHRRARQRRAGAGGGGRAGALCARAWLRDDPGRARDQGGHARRAARARARRRLRPAIRGGA